MSFEIFHRAQYYDFEQNHFSGIRATILRENGDYIASMTPQQEQEYIEHQTQRFTIELPKLDFENMYAQKRERREGHTVFQDNEIFRPTER